MSEKTNNEKDKESKIDEKINNETEKKNNEDVIDEKENQINELTNLLKRVQAEFSNYIKRTDEEKKLYIRNASKDLMLKMLPILDNFELALKNCSNNPNNSNNPSNSNNGELIKGIEMIYSQLISLLENEGLTQICNLEKFDPNFHEAVAVEESDKENGLILEELRKGYTLNGNVLRHSLVKVSKNFKRDNDENDDVFVDNEKNLNSEKKDGKNE